MFESFIKRIDRFLWGETIVTTTTVKRFRDNKPRGNKAGFRVEVNTFS